MTVPPRRRSVVLNGHRTSVSVEDEFWEALREIGQDRDRSMNALIGDIDRGRHANLSSAIRLFVLGVLRAELRAARTSEASRVET